MNEPTNPGLEDLRANPKNPRTITKAAAAALAKSLAEFGDISALVRNTTSGMLVGGHQRVAAFRADKAATVTITERLPEPDSTGTTAVGFVLTNGTRYAYREVAWNEEKEKAAMIAANQHSGEWDDEALRALLKDMDTSLLGFTDQELSILLTEPKKAGNTDPEETPPPPEKPITVPGDIWILGKHRIMCGDSESPDNVKKLLGGEKPHLMVTDPPYGVEYDPSRTSKNPKKAGVVLNDDKADWTKAWELFPGAVCYVWHASIYTSTVLKSLESCGFQHRSMIIWAKDRFTLGRGHYHWQHEPAWYCVRKGAKSHWCADRKQTTLWNIVAREDSGHGHSTQKPVECMRRPIENNSLPGDMVYEPFSGSGTTIIAAEQSGRICLAMELNPVYVDVAVVRWQNFTGQVATHAVTGAPFGKHEPAST